MENKTVEILKTAILMERRGKEFYETVSQKTDIEEVKKIFDIMAKEEIIHEKFLRTQLDSFHTNEYLSELELPEETDDAVVNLILDDKVKDKISGASFEAAAISAAIDMENKAIEIYGKRAEEAIDPHEKELFSWLAEWEKGHHRILYELDQDLKERIWNDMNFYPF